MTRTIDDPVFGVLEYHESGCWRGDVEFDPAGEEVGIEIKTGGPEPAQVHRQFFRELNERYKALLPALGQALFQLYPPHLAASAVKPRNADDMIALTQLNRIEVLSDRELRLGYGFRPEVGSDEAMFTVLVKEWSAVGESLED